MKSGDELPDGMETAVDFDGDRIERRADVAVVGLGAGGGMAFSRLVEAGVDVIGIEMGGHFEPEEMSLREEQMLSKLFCEGAARTTADMAINVMQGKGVGGSTIHNTNLCKRIPDGVRDRWMDAGVEGLEGELDEDFEAVERRLNVHPIPEDRINANNGALLRGIDELGYDGGGLSYNRKLCRASGFCELGCPNDGKENAARSLVLPALDDGGRVLIRTRIDEIVHDEKRVTGLKGRAVAPDGAAVGPEVFVHADAVVLAASATGSAALALKSGVPDPQRLVGRRLHLHPGAYAMGIYDEPVEGWLGVPQSVECTEFLEHGTGAQRRVWLVAGFAHPATAAGLMPGFGAAHGTLMKLYPHVAATIAMLHDESSGAVRPGDGERVHIHYRLTDDDYAQLAVGLREAARIHFAAGARQVLLPTSPPRLLESMDEAARLTPSDLGPHNPPLVAVHPMSTMWMGEDRDASVVDSYGKHHRLGGLYVADGSLFPSSIGGPPQIPIYAMGRRVARRVASEL